MEVIKELLKTKRGQAILKLGGYIIFFVILAVFFRVGPSEVSEPNEEIKKTPLEKYSEMTNYEYTYLYNDDLLIHGKVYRDNLKFSISEKEYYIDEKVYEIINNETQEKIEAELDKIYYITNHDIVNYINNSTIVGKNEDYEKNELSTKFNIDLTNLDLDYDNMYITLYEQEDSIYKVLIEFNKESDIRIVIEYQNVGQIRTLE